jgi:hypothetical protein
MSKRKRPKLDEAFNIIPKRWKKREETNLLFIGRSANKILEKLSKPSISIFVLSDILAQ